MGRKSKQGVCSICKTVGKLSFEHVPPQKAYNNITTIEYEWQNAVVNGKKGKGRQRQGGIGEYTLCQQCNSDTGSWYGNEYVNWARMGHSLLQKWVAINVNNGIVTFRNVYPLRFLKQVITMFFSLYGKYSGHVFSANHPQLSQFVLDKQNTQLPTGFRFWMNFYPFNSKGSTSFRRMPRAAKITVVDNTEGRIGVQSAASFNEITHPPFALYMTINNTMFPNSQEITTFTQYGYDDKDNVLLNLRIMNSSSPYPGA